MDEPVDPHDDGDLPWVEPTRARDGEDGSDDDADGGAAGRDEAAPKHTWVFVIAAAVLVVVGLTVGIIVFNRSAPDPNRGAGTPQEAAARFVTALNDGDGDAAAGIACDTFLKTARAEARSGGQGIRFRVVSVSETADDTALSVIEASLSVGSAKQTDRERISVFRTNGLWLMCGQD